MNNSEPRQLRLVIAEAKELKSNNFGSTSDPYVVVIYKNQTFKTDVIKNTILPIWNHIITLDGVDDSSLITFEIYDWERIGSHKLLGSATLNAVELKDLTLRGMRDKWITLTKKGFLRITFDFTPALVVAQQAADGTIQAVPVITNSNPSIGYETLPPPVHLQPLFVYTYPLKTTVEFSTPGEIYSQKTYLTGSTIESSIIYTVSEPQIVVRSLFVVFKGKVSSRNKKVKTLVMDSRDLLHTYNVQGARRINLSRGKHVFPFQFYIPKECKSSVYDGDYLVDYNFTFYADIVNSPDVLLTKKIFVVNLEDTTLKQTQLPIEAHASKTPLTGGSIEFKVTGAKNCYFQGEDIELEVRCVNHSKKTIKKIDFSLVRNEERNGVRNITQLARSTKTFFPKVYRDTTAVQFMVFELPSNVVLTPTLFHKDIIRIDYQLVVNLDIPNCVDLSQRIPINIIFRDPSIKVLPDPLTEVSSIPKYIYSWNDRHVLSWLQFRMKVPASVIEEFDRFNIQGFDIMAFEESLLERMLSGAGDRTQEVLRALLEERHKVLGVRTLLKDLQLPNLIEIFEEQCITTDLLPTLTINDLNVLKMTVGDRKRILNAIDSIYHK